jgi:hypothetical protein
MHAPVRSSARKLFFILTSVLSLAMAATALHAQYDPNDPPPQAGNVSLVQGPVSVQPAGTNDWGQAYPNLPVVPGDRIFVQPGGHAEIQIGQVFVRLGDNADVTLTEASPARFVFAIGSGAVEVFARGFWPGQSIALQTPNGSMQVGMPSRFRVDVLPDDNASIYTVFKGYTTLNSYNLSLTLPENQPLELFGTNPVVSQWLNFGGYDAFDNWSFARDAQIINSASFQYVSQEVPGAWQLDAAGQWTPGTPYGPIWFPSVQAGWAPYRYGHWVSRNPWGWIWVEDEPWGYAPFHYGRWVQWGGRWGWVPGPPASHPVWSPALVVFAGGVNIGGGGVSVWFPLGPGEAYRPWYPCSPAYINQVNITNITPAPRVVVQTNYVNIVNVTNVTYVNRTVGVTAVPAEAMTSGRSVAQAHVQVDANVIAHAQVLAKPAVAPPARPSAGPPPARPVPAKFAAARPTVMNEKGQLVAATPHAKPTPPPVRPAPQVKLPAGRASAAPPPGSKAPNAIPPGKQTAAKPNAEPAAKPSKPAAKPADQNAKPGQAGKPNPKDKNKKPKPEEKKPEEQKPEDKPQ